ncbi:FAD/NAD(P)-binding protein [Streptomyces albulus]|nr:FAD/NAD(P)-binding protein [Streptomyces noursei]
MHNPTDEVLNVAIVGTGPRGISVFERIAANLTAEPEPRTVRIWLIDAVELGAGRIWQTNQETCFLMNTVVGEISMFSGVFDRAPCRPGAGLSFQQWLRTQPEPALSGLGHDDYAPRYAYGRYLRYVYDSVVRGMSGLGDVVEVVGTTTSLREVDSGYELRVSTVDGELTVTADAVVITTGHAPAVLSGHQAELAGFARERPELRYLSGDSAADLGLSSIEPGAVVGVVGLGLSFYDILMSFTVGRGGRFKEGPDGSLFYVPSGNEPRVVAGSRSGLPIRSRGRNQKGVTSRAAPKFLTSAAVGRLRERNVQQRGNPALDFDRDVLPLLRAEVNYVYYTTQARTQHGPDRAEAVAAELRALGPDPAGWRGGAAPRTDGRGTARPGPAVQAVARQAVRLRRRPGRRGAAHPARRHRGGPPRQRGESAQGRAGRHPGLPRGAAARRGLRRSGTAVPSGRLPRPVRVAHLAAVHRPTAGTHRTVPGSDRRRGAGGGRAGRGARLRRRAGPVLPGVPGRRGLAQPLRRAHRLADPHRRPAAQHRSADAAAGRRADGRRVRARRRR